MGICYLCGKETELEYRCPYCNLTFCDDHRLPEQHNCINIPDRDWEVYRKESIRMGRIKPVQRKKERLLDGFGRYIMQPDDTSKKEYDKDTDSSFIRKGARVDKNIIKQKSSKLDIIFRIIVIIILILTALIVLHEFGYINLYELYGYIKEWLTEVGMRF